MFGADRGKGEFEVLRLNLPWAGSRWCGGGGHQSIITVTRCAFLLEGFELGVDGIACGVDSLPWRCV